MQPKRIKSIAKNENCFLTIKLIFGQPSQMKAA